MIVSFFMLMIILKNSVFMQINHAIHWKKQHCLFDKILCLLSEERCGLMSCQNNKTVLLIWGTNCNRLIVPYNYDLVLFDNESKPAKVEN